MCSGCIEAATPSAAKCGRSPCFWPGAAKIFAQVDSPITLAFLQRYPSPIDARGLGEQRLAGFLDRHGYSGRRSPGELLGRLRGAVEGRAGEIESRARRQIVLGLIAALQPLIAKISELTREIGAALEQHPDSDTFRSLFIDPHSVVCATTRLAETGDSRERYPTYRALAADGGPAPVAVESGKSKRARFRWACDHRLKDAIATIANTSRHHNPCATHIYTRARARGATHQHTIRILGRAWCTVT